MTKLAKNLLLSSSISKNLPLANFGDKLAVGAVRIGDKPVIHLTHTKHLIHKCLRLTVAQLNLFSKEFSAANFDCVGIGHRKRLMYREYT